MAIPREPKVENSNLTTGGLRRDYTPTPQITYAYILGVLHDATIRKTTYRISSKNKKYCLVLQNGLKELGNKSWIYREGKNRNLWILEFSKNILKGKEIKTKQEKIDYIRGYFDTDGGIAISPDVRYYIYFAQRDKNDLIQVKNYLTKLGISCGKVHIPSKKVDPNYFRFFIRAKSYSDFAKIVGSAHPVKCNYLRMKI